VAGWLADFATNQGGWLVGWLILQPTKGGLAGWLADFATNQRGWLVGWLILQAST
jgi:uncharacterized membrane protein YeaQ/YmgE (transglycosylase-associated protein family)